ncbi:MAG: Minf_1886 family protein, partial [Chthoniobacterales bacterium]
MQKPAFHETLDQVVARDPRYTKEAYGFLREALEFTQKRRRKSRAESTHVSAAELLGGFREYSLQQFGPMGLTVLEYWGVRSTGDVGRMVFNLIEAGVFGRADDDRIEDFENGFSFEEAFLVPFRPIEKKSSRRAPRSRKVAQ